MNENWSFHFKFTICGLSRVEGIMQWRHLFEGVIEQREGPAKAGAISNFDQSDIAIYQCPLLVLILRMTFHNGIC